jgi:hypothetical protein
MLQLQCWPQPQHPMQATHLALVAMQSTQQWLLLQRFRRLAWTCCRHCRHSCRIRSSHAVRRPRRMASIQLLRQLPQAMMQLLPSRQTAP